MCQTLCVTNIVPRVNFNVNKKDHYHQSRHEDTTFLCVWNLELFYKSKCIRIYFFQDLILGLVLIISKFQVYIMHYGNIYVYACQNANTFTIDLCVSSSLLCIDFDKLKPRSKIQTSSDLWKILRAWNLLLSVARKHRLCDNQK